MTAATIVTLLLVSAMIRTRLEDTPGGVVAARSRGVAVTAEGVKTDWHGVAHGRHMMLGGVRLAAAAVFVALSVLLRGAGERGKKTSAQLKGTNPESAAGKYLATRPIRSQKSSEASQ